MKWIRWKGKKYLFVGDALKHGGAIATAKQYKSGQTSTAHLFPDGIIRQYGEDVGKRADLKILGPANVTPSDEAFERVLFGWSW